MNNLLNQKCVPCEGGIAPLSEDKENEYLKEIKDWTLERKDVHHIKKEFLLKNFLKAIEFVNKVAEIAENEGHHPNIYIYYNKVDIEIYTHAIKGLHKNDFILAAKIDNI